MIPPCSILLYIFAVSGGFLKVHLQTPKQLLTSVTSRDFFSLMSVHNPGFCWKLHPSPWHTYTQRVWNVLVEAPSQDSSPISLQTLPHLRKPAKRCPTSTGHLNCPPENRYVVLHLSFLASLGGLGGEKGRRDWKIILERFIH